MAQDCVATTTDSRLISSRSGLQTRFSYGEKTFLWEESDEADWKTSSEAESEENLAALRQVAGSYPERAEKQGKSGLRLGLHG